MRPGSVLRGARVMFVCGVLAAQALSGCSLLLATDGLTGDRDTAANGGEGGSSSPGSDGLVGGGTSDAAIDGATTRPDGATDGSSRAAITYVARYEASATTSGSTISTPAKSTGATAGNTLVCWLHYESGMVASSGLTDSQNDTFKRATGPVRATGSGSGWSDEVWYALDIEGGSNFSVTATLTGAVSNRNLSCHEYAGIRELDQANTLVASGSGPRSTPAVTVEEPGELLFSAFSSQGPMTPGAGFTVRSTLDGDLTQDRVLAAAGTAAATLTCSADCFGSAVFFRAR